MHGIVVGEESDLAQHSALLEKITSRVFPAIFYLHGANQVRFIYEQGVDGIDLQTADRVTPEKLRYVTESKNPTVAPV
jgi:hypothetical protein